MKVTTEAVASSPPVRRLPVAAGTDATLPDGRYHRRNRRGPWLHPARPKRLFAWEARAGEMVPSACGAWP